LSDRFHRFEQVKPDDIFKAESQYSSDMLDELRYEIRDIYPNIADFALSFLNVENPLTGDEVNQRLINAGIAEENVATVKNILLWFSFFGVHIGDTDSYAYDVSYDVAKLEAQHDKSQALYSIHPAFKKALTV